MISIFQKVVIIISILLFKILVWFVFQNGIVELSNYICEYLGIVPIGTQMVFSGIPKLIAVIKVSFVILDILLDLIILIFVKFLFKNFILKRFIYIYLIVSFILLIFILSIF